MNVKKKNEMHERMIFIFVLDQPMHILYLYIYSQFFYIYCYLFDIVSLCCLSVCLIDNGNKVCRLLHLSFL